MLKRWTNRRGCSCVGHSPSSCWAGGVDNLLPGRQGRLSFAYLVVSRLLPVSRNSLIDALWGDAPPADAAGALNALISKTRAVVGRDVLRGRTELILTLPEPAQVDVEVALSKLQVAESATSLAASASGSTILFWLMSCWPTVALLPQAPTHTVTCSGRCEVAAETSGSSARSRSAAIRSVNTA
jgi:hypothetical protein